MALNNMLSSLSGMNLLRNDSIPLDYTHDELAGGVGCMPEAVVEVRTADEVSAVMKLCAAEGVAVTVLRPAGMAEFDGVKLNVVSDGEFIPEGERVRVSRVEGNRIVVVKAEA